MRKTLVVGSLAAIALALFLVSTDSIAIDPAKYVPYDEKPYRKYDPTACNKFLEHDKDIRYIKPSRAAADKLLERCPEILDIGERRPPDEYALYRVDIDNDGVEDQVLSITYIYSNMDPRSLFKVNPKTCKREPVLSAYGPKRLLLLDGNAFIESTEICRGPYSISGRDRYLHCKNLYRKTVERDLKQFQDVACVFIEKEWLKVKDRNK